MSKRNNVTTQVLVVTALVLVTMSAWSAPQLSFDSDRIVASGITTNGLTWWFGAAHMGLGWEHRIITLDRRITDHDDDGTVELVWEHSEELPSQSVWLVIDVASGEYTMAAPPGSPLRQIDLGPDDLVSEGGQIVAVAQEQVRFLEALLARPNSGYYRQTSGDGSPNDDDGLVNGKIVIRFAEMEAAEGAMPESPESIILGDVVAVVDALELGIGVYIVGDKAAEAEEEVAQ